MTGNGAQNGERVEQTTERLNRRRGGKETLDQDEARVNLVKSRKRASSTSCVTVVGRRRRRATRCTIETLIDSRLSGGGKGRESANTSNTKGGAVGVKGGEREGSYNGEEGRRGGCKGGLKREV